MDWQVLMDFQGFPHIPPLFLQRKGDVVENQSDFQTFYAQRTTTVFVECSKNSDGNIHVARRGVAGGAQDWNRKKQKNGVERLLPKMWIIRSSLIFQDAENFFTYAILENTDFQHDYSHWVINSTRFCWKTQSIEAKGSKTKGRDISYYTFSNTDGYRKIRWFRTKQILFIKKIFF